MKNTKVKKLWLIFISTIILAITGNALASFAVTSSELKNQQQQNQEKINEAKQEQHQIQSQLSAAQKEVDDLNNQIASYQNEIDSLTSQIEDATAKIVELNQEIEAKQKELEEKQDLLDKRLVAAYKAGNTSYLDLLLSSEDLTSFLSNYYLIEQIADSDTKLINSIKETKEKIEADKVSVEETKRELETTRTLQESKKNSLSALREQKAQVVAQLSSEEQAVQSSIDQMQEQDAVIRSAIKKAVAAEAAAEAARRAQQSSSSSSATATSRATTSNPGGFIYPVPSAYSSITTGLYYSKGGYHGAVDFGVGGIDGQPVYAVKSGTVILTQSLTYSYGNYVIIDHHDGTYTLYAHGQAGSICVAPGQSVSQGQQIMRVGSTGNSTGPHLHFEVRVAPGGYSNRVSPYNYLP